jgi:hypothetical protein
MPSSPALSQERVREDLFYVGRRVDEKTLEVSKEPVYIDRADLVTHAMVLGMTGSGKTGACLVLLEEAILQGIPAILIDPKGDLTNLMLAFPEMRSEDFERWICLDEARRHGKSVQEYAKEVAESWREGLAKWGITQDKVRRLKEIADVLVFTPGSDAGIPVSILQTLQVPVGLSWDRDAEILRERIRDVASALLDMIGHESDPVKSKEHILISNVIEHAWRNGQALDIPMLIGFVRNPPFTQLGVIEVDTFVTPEERQRLAVDLNKIIASPSFESWVKGIPLDVGFFFGIGEKKPRISIFYIAHLDERERHFFVTLLLWQLFGWMITQPGSPTVKYLFYFDEIYGYLPPHPYTPPTKRPLTLLLKQGRAFGLGNILATQNPVDVDYKALSNCGIWIIGKLQTTRDRMRVLEGLSTVFSEQGVALDQKTLDRIITSLRSRLFVLHSAKQTGPIIFATRHLMVYHRGPLTKDEVREITAPQRDRFKDLIIKPTTTKPEISALTQPSVAYAITPTPSLPEALPQFYISIQKGTDWIIQELRSRVPRLNFALSGSTLTYHPALYCEAIVKINRASPKVKYSEQIRRLLPASENTLDWDSESAYGMTIADVFRKPFDIQSVEKATFAPINFRLKDKSKVEAVKKQFELYAMKKTVRPVYYHPLLDRFSAPGVAFNSFREEVRRTVAEIQRKQAMKIEEAFERAIASVRRNLERRQEELTAKTRFIQTLDREIQELNDRIKKVKREGRGVTRLRDQVEARKLRRQTMYVDVRKLQQEILSLEAKIKGIVRQRDMKLTALNAEIKTLESAGIETREIQPKRGEVDVTIFELIWIPVFSAKLEVSRGSFQKFFTLSWNGLTGSGDFGYCKTCHKLLETLPSAFCETCLAPICDEDKLVCAGCGKAFCREDFQKHLIPCATCKREVCPSLLVQCPICGRMNCERCLVVCNICGLKVCKHDSWSCPTCGTTYCIKEGKYTCAVCGQTLCAACSQRCEICGKIVCRQHISVCPHCGAKTCPDCLIRTRKLLFPVIRCKRCLKNSSKSD